MVRSMYSGVSGMKAHQTKMDVIGNNISNVNTYGFKSSRVTFRDVYYQSMRNPSAGTANRGGTNPSQVGYGAAVGSIDVNQSQSIMQNTGNPLDTAIAGDGFFQVQDADGNVFYTKAGMLDIDSAGNLVDVNGNFVLGVSGNPMGKSPQSNRIQLTVPSVNPAVSSYEEGINGVKFKISSTKQNSDANVTFTFMASNELPVGQKAKAIITSSGINIALNSKEDFSSIGELNTEINKAIRTANGGQPHPGGDFSITMDPATKFSGALSGAEIANSNFGINLGTVSVPTAWKNIFSIETVGEEFSGHDAIPQYTVTKTDGSTATPPVDDTYKISINIGGTIYENVLTASQMSAPGSVLLDSGADGDTITLNYPTVSSMESVLTAAGNSSPWTASGTEDAMPSKPSNDLGLGGAPFKLKGGTEGGAQTVEDLSGIAIGSDGVIIGNHPVHGMMELGRIDLATFANPKGLVQSGNTYYAKSPNSGEASYAKPGERGTGALTSGSLEMSNVDLSNEFSDMITTQRGFQANSRLITVSDTMLEELINLKR